MAKKCKKLEEIKDMVKNLDINYDEMDLSVLKNSWGLSRKVCK